MLRITLKKSVISCQKRQRSTAKALGLGKLNSSTVKPDNPQVRGMVRKISHLVDVEQVEQEMPGGKASETK